MPAFASKLHLTVNGSPVPLVPDTGAVTATLRMGQGGLHCLRVTVPLQRPHPGERAVHGDVLGRHLRKPGGLEGDRHAGRARGGPHPVVGGDA